MVKMAHIEWTKKLETGVAKIDFQHRLLVQMINDIAVLAVNDQPDLRSQEIGRSIWKLMEYTVFHFQFEEELLEKCNFPDLKDHKRSHENLSQKVLDLSIQFESGEDVGGELLDFLKSWLEGHILGTDMKYVEIVKKNFPNL
jgi:hemerythrin